MRKPGRAELQRSSVEQGNDRAICAPCARTWRQEHMLTACRPPQKLIGHVFGEQPLASQQVLVRASQAQIIEAFELGLTSLIVSSEGAEQRMQSLQQWTELHGQFGIEPAQPLAPGSQS